MKETRGGQKGRPLGAEQCRGSLSAGRWERGVCTAPGLLLAGL